MANKVGAQFLINDGLYKFIRKPFHKDKEFLRNVRDVFEDAAKIVKKSVISNIKAMRAVGSGFMAKNVVYIVELSRDNSTPVKVRIGTRAWYDILVHEGLGIHGSSGSRAVPSRYRPTAQQLEEAEAAPYTRAYRFKFYKPSPRVKRPFLKNAITQNRNQIKGIIYRGLAKAFNEYTGSGRGSKPRISITQAFQGKF